MMSTAGYLLFVVTSTILSADSALSEFDVLGSNGEWSQQGDEIVQTQATDASTVCLANCGQKSHVRVMANIQLDPTERIGAEAGVVVHAENKDCYILCSIRRNKGGYYAMLTRYGPGYDWGRMPGDMARLPKESATGWHTIELLADGAHVQATIDGSIELAFSYPRLADGMPICVGDQTKDIRLASNWGPEMFDMKGRVGLATRLATARFRDLKIEDLPSGVVVHTPYKPIYDATGRVQARWPYATIMRRYTEWFLESGSLVTAEGGSKEAQDANLDEVMQRTGWPPYFLTWATVTDDMGFDAPAQYPTHNGPPTISGYLQYYLFSGDERFIKPARQWADWMIDHFSTPADFAFPYLPKTIYSYDDRFLQASPLADNLELDKASYMGLSYLDLYGVTGDQKYSQAAQRIADTLLPHQRTDGSIPFRINLKSGEVTGGYTCSQIWHAQLFRKLAELTGRPEYQQAGGRLVDWMVQGPIKTNQWWGFYGDNPDAGEEKSMDQWVALETAQWLADHHQENEAYLPAAREVLSYVEKNFFKLGGLHQGVPAIGEQTGWPAILPHHNMRLAETYAQLYGATGDPEAKELALRISNSMSQMVMNDGKFHHGLNSGIENRTALVLNFNLQFSRIMAEIPETAPQDENHLLYCSGYARNIHYQPEAINYETLGPTQDILVVQSRPERIEVAGKVIPPVSESPASRTGTEPIGWLYEPDHHRLIIVHPDGQVMVTM